MHSYPCVLLLALAVVATCAVVLAGVDKFCGVVTRASCEERWMYQKLLSAVMVLLSPCAFSRTETLAMPLARLRGNPSLPVDGLEGRLARCRRCS